MRRYNPPYNGKRYLLNTNSGEIHDLDNETSNCQINEIRREHICMGDTYQECLVTSKISGYPDSNGCCYCLKERDIG